MSSSAPVPVAPLARVAHDVGLAALVGGNLFGRLALHPSVAEISVPAERGKVVNAAWRRYGTVNGLGLIGVVGGWAATRRVASPETEVLGTVGDVLVAVTAVTGLATAVEGVRFARREPDGAVPLADGATAAPEATEAEAKAKRRLDRLGALGLTAELGLLVLGGVLAAQTDGRGAALRRVVTG